MRHSSEISPDWPEEGACALVHMEKSDAPEYQTEKDHTVLACLGIPD